MEETIVLILVALTILTIFCLYKMLDKRGLYFALVILNVISFVLTFKVAYVFKLNVNMGIIPFIATTTVIYLFIIKYGYQEIKNFLKICFYTNVATALLLIVMNYFIPAITETISINMQGTFEYNYKILIIYPFIMLITQYIIAKLYKIIAQIQNTPALCIILIYIITALLYTVVFYLLCYIQIMETKYSLFLGISTYIIGLPITILNVIFVNLITSKKKVIK